MSLIARLIEAGTPPELVEEVALLVAEKRLAAEAIEQRRASDRDRQARRRAEADNVTSRDITGQGVTDEAAPLSAPPNDIYSNPPHHTPQHTTGAREAFPCPEWCEPAVWSDLKRNRKAKRLANTATAHAQFLREIDKLADDEWPPGRLVEAIVAKGWGGAYDPRDQSGKTGKQGNGRQGNSSRNTFDLAMQKLGIEQGVGA